MKAAGKRYIQYASRKDVFRLWGISDIHLGNRGCSVDRLQQDINDINEDPFSLWVGGGDYAEYIPPSDTKRFDPETLAESFKVRDLGRVGTFLMAQVKSFFEPIKEKCVGLAYGNHEWYYMLSQNQQDLHGWLCTELGVENLGFCAFLDLIFVRQPGLKGGPVITRESPEGGANRWAVRVFIHHGASGSITPGGKIKNLADAMTRFDADMTFVAHVHAKIGTKLVRIRANRACKKIKETELAGTISGTYLRTYSEGAAGYGERRMYPPAPLGAPWARIHPDIRDIKVVV